MDVTKRSDKQGFLRSRAAAWLFLTSALVGIMLACSGEGGTYLPADGGAEPSVGGPCVEESERACGLTLEVNGDSMTCYRGTQVCEGGVWSPCRDGSVTREPLPSLGFDPTKRRVYANPSLSDPVACGNGQGTGGSGSGGGPSTADFANPCDPGCMHFEENPADLNANGGSSAGPPLEFPPRGCGQSLCIASNGWINPTCDPCAASVIAAHPSCQESWNEQCVFWATTSCENVTPPTNICDFGLFAETKLTVSNEASANATIGAYGDVEIKAGASTFGSIYSNGNVTVASLNNAPIAMKPAGGIFANGSIFFQNGGGADITGSLHAGTTVTMDGIDVLQGNVWAGTNILGNGTVSGGGEARAVGTISGSVTVTPGANKKASYGTAPPAVSLPPKTSGTSIPILPMTSCPMSAGMERTGNQVLTPGVYGAVNANNVELDGQGTYYFYSLKVAKSLVLNMKNQPYSTGFDVRVCNAPAGETYQTTMFESGAKVVGKNGATNDANGVLLNPKYLTLYYRSAITVTMQPDVYWTGIFIAPNAKVEKAAMNTCNVGSPGCPVASPPPNNAILNGTRAAPINGAIWAKEVQVEPKALTRAITSADCNEIEHLPIVSPPECPLEDGARGLKNEPCASGQDCQANSHCFRPKTGATCGGSKCVPRPGPLPANCDPCVARICKTMPSCCTGSWNADCVAAVSTICDAVCQEGDCTQDPCAASTQPIPKTCQDNVGADCIKKTCDAMPSCCTTAWTSACVNKMMEPGICGSINAQKRLCDLAVYATNTYTKNGATVNGLEGTAAALDPDPSFSMHNGYFSCQLGRPSHGPANGNLSIAPGHYGKIRMGVGTTLTFQGGGSYYMTELTLEGDNTIVLPAMGAFIDLVVCGGKITIGPNTKYSNISTAMGGPSKLHVYTNHPGAEAIWIHPSTTPIATPAAENTSFGLLVASNGEVRIGGNIHHHGMIWARDVTLAASSAVTYAQPVKDECINYPLDGGNVPGGAVCAIDLVPVPASESATCVDNATNYKDPTCAGYDLALGTPCKIDENITQIPVCNHGTGPFPAAGSLPVRIAYYQESLGQLAIDEPTVLPTGMCPQVSISSMSPIAPGTCRMINCEIPAGRYTLFLDPANPPPKLLSECNNRRLDNWSATDGRECIPFSQPRTVEYEYEAECPEESKALWGSLTWNTTTPGDSRVVFSLKAGENDAELDAATYVEAGIAQRAPEDTQVCVFKDTTPCYADVTETLDLGRNQPQLLRLKADLLPGNGSPVLRDWGISYSCVYDE